MVESGRSWPPPENERCLAVNWEYVRKNPGFKRNSEKKEAFEKTTWTSWHIHREPLGASGLAEIAARADESSLENGPC
jgi:hypothetical protein